MPSYTLTYKEFGENALLIEWPARIDEAILQDIIRFQAVLENTLGGGLLECQPAYNSLTLFFNSEKLSSSALEKQARRLYENAETMEREPSRCWQLPVCYDSSFGIDLQEVARQKGITEETLIQLHSQGSYTVYFIGFLPGFLYLGGLPEELQLARRESPRLRLPRGAVGIAGRQTGIYPQESPGGWHILGNCPIPLFNPELDPPCFARPGDQVAFRPISKAEYFAIQQQQKAGNFNLKERLIKEV